MKYLKLSLWLIFTLNAYAAPESAPDRQRGEGPFERLILRGVIVVNGEGAAGIKFFGKRQFRYSRPRDDSGQELSISAFKSASTLSVCVSGSTSS